MRGVTRPELFFMYGIVISALVVVLFFTKINQLAHLEDTVAEYYANELALVIDALSMREGYTRIPFSIQYLENPRVSLDEHSVLLNYVVSGDGSGGGSHSERVLASVRTEEPVTFEQGYVVARDREVWVENTTCTGAPLAGVNTTYGDALRARLVTVIVNDPCMGIVEFDRLESEERIVQRVVVDGDLDSEVVILAR